MSAQLTTAASGPRQGAAGYALLEYLAALALTATAVLGLLQTQTLNARLEREISDRIQASLLLTDLSRRMDFTHTALNAFNIGFGAPPPIGQDCRISVCTDHDLAAFHLAHWKCRLGHWAKTAGCQGRFAQQAQLPQGDGSIAAHGNRFKLTLRWRTLDGDAQTLTRDYVPLSD